jgi:tocopherol O-methyltransferase
MEQDVAAYYNQTQNHYKRWWKLDKEMALHYGLWYSDTKSFSQALLNTNIYMAKAAKINAEDIVLDAGCGVGGAAIYLANECKAEVNGISLSELQIATAVKNAEKIASKHKISFQVQDYCNTQFEDASFDVIWACESSSSAPDKVKMLTEWTRLLKPGGRLIILDFFKTESVTDKNSWLDDWASLWAMSPLVTDNDMVNAMQAVGLTVLTTDDLSKEVAPTVKRMYWSYLFGKYPSKIYNSLFGARDYAKNHYKSGYYQYQAFQKKQWKYLSLFAIKP